MRNSNCGEWYSLKNNWNSFNGWDWWKPTFEPPKFIEVTANSSPGDLSEKMIVKVDDISCVHKCGEYTQIYFKNNEDGVFKESYEEIKKMLIGE